MLLGFTEDFTIFHRRLAHLEEQKATWKPADLWLGRDRAKRTPSKWEEGRCCPPAILGHGPWGPKGRLSTKKKQKSNRSQTRNIPKKHKYKPSSTNMVQLGGKRDIWTQRSRDIGRSVIYGQ